MKHRFVVTVTLRSGLADPAGSAVEGSLPALGFEGVSGVRIGKHIELSVEAAGATQALETARIIAEKILSNPVIEDVQVMPA